MKNLITAALLTTTLAGCSNGMPTFNPEESNMTEQTEKIFVGIPIVLGFEGSVARLDEEWVVTVAHNKPILSMKREDVYYHPVCDIAVYRDKGITADVGVVYQGDDITHVGYPMWALPMAANEGHFLGGLQMLEAPECKASAASDGVVVQGMSGGGVYNNKEELVGVNVGYYNKVTVEYHGVEYKDPSVFISLYDVREWLEEVTGNDYFKGM